MHGSSGRWSCAILAFVVGLAGQISWADEWMFLLASGNEPPVMVIRGITAYPEVPANFSWDEQARVAAIIGKIDCNKKGVLPFLCDQIDNEAYCITVAYFGESAEVLTVGEVCETLIRDSLAAGYRECWPREVGIVSHILFPKFLPESGPELAKHVRSRIRAGESLARLQQESCRKAIEWLETTDLTDMLVSDKERAKAIGCIRARLTKLEETGEGVPAQGLFVPERTTPLTKAIAERLKRDVLRVPVTR